MFRSTAPSSTMAISTSPRKVVPLSTGDDMDTRSRPSAPPSGPAVTKRAFFCGVVVEGPGDGMDLSEEVQDLVASLGDRIPSDREFEEISPSLTSSSQPNGVHTRARALTNTSALADLVNELVTTERTYVQRLRILKDAYADPLRSYARSKDTAIIAAYEAKILFGNIDQLLPANEAFLHDLEQMLAPDGAQTVGGVGNVTLHHFKDLRAFECYKQYYVKREEAQLIFKREMAKKSSTGFAAFVERIKYSTNDQKNRVGLRELLMEPVQRIPRYTLLFRSMIKLMAPSDPQRASLAEADEIASRIALAETDDHTRLAATLNCLATSIEGFPPALISSSRRFIDCIDVEDNLTDGMGTNLYGGVVPAASINSNSSSGGSSLHCTLILFDDKLMIVKRSSSDKSGRALTGLDEVEKFTNGGFSARGRGLTSIKRGSMSCKGVVDITDIVVTDVAGPDMHLYLENPPSDQSDRWSGRPFRVLSVVHPPYAVNQDPIRTECDKRRFLENLWKVQARYRTRAGQSVALCADDREVEARGGKVTVARTYFNVYQRTSFLKEPKKTKVVLHIDSLGHADPLPFGLDGAPYVIVRVQPLAGDLCRYTVHSNDPDDEPEEDVIQTCRVPVRIVHTIHQYGLFKFRTNNPSRPATPSGSHRSRAHIFGLDVISRNLFGALPGSSKNGKDPFGSGSIGSHRRSKSAMSRVSTIRTDTTGTTTTTTTADSSTRFSSRSNSTAATSISSFIADEDSFIGRSVSKTRKLVKRNRSRSRSPGAGLGDYGSESELDGTSSRRSRSMSVSRNEESVEYSDHEDVPAIDMRKSRRLNQSEMDLTMRLELARRNSKNQHGLPVQPGVVERPIEETIYEEEPPLPTRPASRASRSTHSSQSTYERDALSLRSTSPHPTTRSITPTPATESSRKGRPESIQSRERRPFGPRSPSPLPPTSPTMHSMQLDIEGALESTLASMSPVRSHTPLSIPPESKQEDEYPPMPVTPSQLPRSKRQPFVPMGNTEATPRMTAVGASAAKSTNGVEPLSIKKKASTGGSHGGPASARKPLARDSPLTRRSSKVDSGHPASPSATSRQLESQTTGSSLRTTSLNEIPQKLLRLAETTREDLNASRRALKRIKLEVNALPTRNVREGSDDVEHRPLTPSRGLPRTPTRSNAANKEALDRLEEMRSIIGQRNGGTPRGRPKSVIEASSSSSSLSASNGARVDTPEIHNWARSIDELAVSADRDISRAASNHEILEGDLKQLASDVKERSLDLEKSRSELRSTKRQCELVKNLLADATAENEIMYEAFNEELDGMFNDANLPMDEAWTAMTTDLRKTKIDKNALARENAQLKRRLQEVEMQRDEWAELLRQHGLIP